MADTHTIERLNELKNQLDSVEKDFHPGAVELYTALSVAQELLENAYKQTKLLSEVIVLPCDAKPEDGDISTDGYVCDNVYLNSGEYELRWTRCLDNAWWYAEEEDPEFSKIRIGLRKGKAVIHGGSDCITEISRDGSK